MTKKRLKNNYYIPYIKINKLYKLSIKKLVYILGFFTDLEKQVSVLCVFSNYILNQEFFYLSAQLSVVVFCCMVNQSYIWPDFVSKVTFNGDFFFNYNKTLMF